MSKDYESGTKVSGTYSNKVKDGASLRSPIFLLQIYNEKLNQLSSVMTNDVVCVNLSWLQHHIVAAGGTR